MPISRPLTKKELDNLKEVRRYGVTDLKKYIQKIKKNIRVFNEAISKEKKEMTRITNMIKVLQNDIKTADELKKTAK
ncbi:MAG: hypothetical protein NTZ93_02435 [Candidatus Beckwithbacteria bacterium]|nr:hypothetical protein [Candidatus Beckwithbacteria bacterium]